MNNNKREIRVIINNIIKRENRNIVINIWMLYKLEL